MVKRGDRLFNDGVKYDYNIVVGFTRCIRLPLFRWEMGQSVWSFEGSAVRRSRPLKLATRERYEQLQDTGAPVARRFLVG